MPKVGLPLLRSHLAKTTPPRENVSGGLAPPETAEELADWWGVIKSMQIGAFALALLLGGAVHQAVYCLHERVGRARLTADEDAKCTL